MGSVQGIADSLSSAVSGATPAGADLLMIGDWGYEEARAQSQVAAAMSDLHPGHALRWQALLLLGDNWYGPLPNGAQSTRWQTQFEEMYPASVFDCPAYAILGNHDYQNMPGSKVAAELEYARASRPGGKATRFTLPSRWYRFEFPAENPLITFIALDSNMPKEKKNDVDFTLTEQDAAQQLSWLEAELKRPRTTPFLVVMGHHPVYSDGPHGDHPVLIKDWDPLFANTRFLRTWLGTITICSIWNLPDIRLAFSCRAVVAPTFITSRSIRQTAAPMRKKSMGLAIFR